MSTNQIQIYTNPDFGDIRTVLINDEPWFVGKDVATALGYENTRDALAKHVDGEDKNTVAIRDGIQGNPNTTVINESGLYSLVFSSKLPKAKEFKHWVTSEVLPSIRKNSVYATEDFTERAINDPDFAIAVFMKLKEERAARKTLEEKVEKDKPKVELAEAISASDGDILVGALAKVLKQNGIDMGQNRLFAWMRDNDYLIKQKGKNHNLPTQKSMDMGLMRIKENAVKLGKDENGQTITTSTPVITMAGQAYFINLFMRSNGC